jgi:hypothetical protein
VLNQPLLPLKRFPRICTTFPEFSSESAGNILIPFIDALTQGLHAFTDSHHFVAKSKSIEGW